MKNSNIILKLVGLVSLGLTIAHATYLINSPSNSIQECLWGCHLLNLLLGIAIFNNWNRLIHVISLMQWPSFLFWLVFIIFMGSPAITSIFSHVIGLSIAVYMRTQVKGSWSNFVFIAPLILFFRLVSYFFTNPDFNVNLVFKVPYPAIKFIHSNIAFTVYLLIFSLITCLIIELFYRLIFLSFSCKNL